MRVETMCLHVRARVSGGQEDGGLHWWTGVPGCLLLGVRALAGSRNRTPAMARTAVPNTLPHSHARPNDPLQGEDGLMTIAGFGSLLSGGGPRGTLPRACRTWSARLLPCGTLGTMLWPGRPTQHAPSVHDGAGCRASLLAAYPALHFQQFGLTYPKALRAGQ